MDSSAFNDRWVLGRRDWRGNYVADWTITPSSREDPVDIVQLDPEDCVPLYPLRYGLTEERCRVDSLGNLSVAEYPGGPEGKAYGLRLLRPRSIVYLLYMEDEELHHLVYQVTQDVCFTPLPLEVAAEAADESEFGDQEDFLFPMGAVTTPWIPAPKTEVTNTVYLMVTDTLLTTETIASLAGRLEELSGSVLTRVRTDQLAEGQRDVLPIAGTLDDPRYVPEMQGEWQHLRNATDLSWSESRPDAPNGSLAVSTLNRFFRRFNGEREDIEPLAVVLHDPVGVMSELNHRLATELTELSEYCRDNVRKRRVKEQIERLGDIRYSEVHRAREEAGEHYSGAGLSPSDLSEYWADVARNHRLSNYRAEEADAFEQEFQQHVTELAQKAGTAAAEQWSDWQGLQERYHAVLELYDETDDTNYLDLRVVVAHTLTGLFHDEDGQAYLKSQMDGDRPLANSLLHRALMGHPLVNDYVTQDAITASKRFDEAQANPEIPLLVTNNNLRVFVDQSVGDALSRVQQVLNRLPDDAASAQLGMVVSALVRSENGSLTFWPSSWRAMLEVLFGEAATPERVPLNQTGAWFAHVSGGSARHPFRPTTASNDPLYLIRTRKLESNGSDRYTPLRAALKAHAHFWYGVKGVVGGLGMWAALDSYEKARNRLNQQDSQVLANSLNLGSAMLAVGAAGTGLLAVGAGWGRDIRMADAGTRSVGGSATRLADRASNWTIGFLAVSAALIGASEYLVKAPQESGEARSLTLSSAMLKFGQTGVGAAHLVGKWRFFTDTLSSASRIAGNSLITRGIGTGAELALRAVSVSASTAGWIMLGLDILYSGIRSWHDRVVAERKFTDWIGRSCWGTGRDSNGEPLQGVFGQDEVEEFRQFYRLFQAPHFEIGYTTPTRDPYGMTTIEEGHAEMTVIFPGWLPQVSQFELLHKSGERVIQRLADASLVEAEEGYGRLTYRTQALINEGRLEIHYWPNRYANDSFILYDEATEKRLDQERTERLEAFHAQQAQKGSAS